MECLTLNELALALALALIFQSLYYVLIYGPAFAVYEISSLAIFYFSVILGIVIFRFVRGVVK